VTINFGQKRLKRSQKQNKKIKMSKCQAITGNGTKCQNLKFWPEKTFLCWKHYEIEFGFPELEKLRFQRNEIKKKEEFEMEIPRKKSSKTKSTKSTKAKKSETPKKATKSKKGTKSKKSTKSTKSTSRSKKEVTKQKSASERKQNLEVKETKLRFDLLNKISSTEFILDFYFASQWEPKYARRGQDWLRFPYEVQHFLSQLPKYLEMKEIWDKIPEAHVISPVLMVPLKSPNLSLEKNNEFWIKLTTRIQKGTLNFEGTSGQSLENEGDDEEHEIIYEYEFEEEWRMKLLRQLKLFEENGPSHKAELLEALTSFLPTWDTCQKVTTIAGISSIADFNFTFQPSSPEFLPKKLLQFGEFHINTNYKNSFLLFSVWLFSFLRTYPTLIVHLFLESAYYKNDVESYKCPIPEFARGWCQNWVQERKNPNGLNQPALLTTLLALEPCVQLEKENCSTPNLYTHYTDIRTTLATSKSLIPWFNSVLNVLENLTFHPYGYVTTTRSSDVKKVKELWPEDEATDFSSYLLELIQEELNSLPLIKKAWTKLERDTNIFLFKTFPRFPKTLAELIQNLLEELQFDKAKKVSVLEWKKFSMWINSIHSEDEKTELTEKEFEKMKEYIILLANPYMDLILLLRFLYYLSKQERNQIYIILVGNTHWQTIFTLFYKWGLVPSTASDLPLHPQQIANTLLKSFYSFLEKVEKD
jgi:hypothetical protein